MGADNTMMVEIVMAAGQNESAAPHFVAPLAQPQSDRECFW